MIITFSGFSGVGKTTQSKLLIEELNRHKIKAKRVNVECHSLLRLISNVLLTLGLFRTQIHSVATYDKPESKTTLIVFIRALFLITDILVFRLFFELPSLFTKTTLICDRYFTDYLIRLKILGLNSKKFDSIILGISKKPDFAFLLEEQDEKLIVRRPNYHSKFIKIKRKLFNSHNDQFGFIKISPGSKNQIHKNITKVIFDSIKIPDKTKTNTNQ